MIENADDIVQIEEKRGALCICPGNLPDNRGVK